MEEAPRYVAEIRIASFRLVTMKLTYHQPPANKLASVFKNLSRAKVKEIRAKDLSHKDIIIAYVYDDESLYPES